MAIIDLAAHPFAYVTVGELAEYWRLSRAHVLTHVYAGHFEAIQFGRGIYRVRTRAALHFEQNALLPCPYRSGLVAWPAPRDASPAQGDTKAGPAPETGVSPSPESEQNRCPGA